MQGVQQSIRGWRAEIDALVAEGAALEELERDVIDAAPLGEDARAALWLYAWGCVERRQRPRVAA